MDEERPRCRRCLTQCSAFWTRFSVGCDSEGNGGEPFELCDECCWDFSRFMKGYVVSETIVKRCRPSPILEPEAKE